MTPPEKVLMPRYRCTHCRKSWASRSTALQHANRCWYDPANRACKTCTHFERSFNEGPDFCAAGIDLPVVELFGNERQTLAVGCDSHRLDAAYVNPDVIDTLDAAAKAAS